MPATLLLLVFGAYPGFAQTQDCNTTPIPPVKVLGDDAAAGDFFGCTLSRRGDLLVAGVIGENDRTGAADLYRAAGGGGWTHVADLLAGDGAAGDQFGYSVGVSDRGTVVVGAPFNDAGGDGAGAAYVFECSIAGCSAPERLPVAAAAQDQYGLSVAIDGDLLAVGGPGGSGAGAVEVYRRDGSGWVREITLSPPGAPAGAGFGFSVSLAGETLLAGAPFEADTGAAYVFDRAGGAWPQRARLIAGDAAAGDAFGFSVATSGGTAMIGAPEANAAGGDSGAVYVFTDEGGDWSQRARLVPAGLAAGDELGTTVAIDGGRALAGAWRDDQEGTNAGAVYAFSGGGASWEACRVTIDGAGAGDEIGFGATIEDDDAVVGAWRDDDRGEDAGAAYSFTLTDDDTADLEVELTARGFLKSEVCPGGRLTFDVTTRNRGPSDAPGATVRADFPRSVIEACRPEGRCGSCTIDGGSISCPIDLPVGAELRTVVDVRIDEDASGEHTNVARLTPPAGLTDPDPSDNEARETTTVLDCEEEELVADLAIAVSFDRAEACPGEVVTKTLVVTNAGPDPAAGATVTDVFPPGFSAIAWSCAPTGGGSCTAAGTGDISDSVTLPVGGTVTYIVAATVDPAASGAITNAAAVAPPSGVTDPPASGNNSGSATVTVSCETDLAISAAYDRTETCSGEVVTKTLVVTNDGPCTAFGATVTDAFDPAIWAPPITWTCSGTGGATCTASGTGDVADVVVVPPGGVLTYTVTAPVAGGTFDEVDNRASVAPAPSCVDPDPGDDSSTVTIPANRAVLTLEKSGPESVTCGTPIAYALTVTNNGRCPTIDAELFDPPPAGTFATTPPADCTAAPCDLPVLPGGGGSTTVITEFDVDPALCPPAKIPNTATADADNAEAVASPTVETDVTYEADLAISLDDGLSVASQSDLLVYELTVMNSGPCALVDGEVETSAPPGLTPTTWVCTPSGGATSTGGGFGEVSAEVTIPPGASVSCLAKARVSGVFLGELVHTARVLDPKGPPASARDTTTIFPISGVGVTKTTGWDFFTEQTVTYVVTLYNGGPGAQPDDPGADEFTDPLPPEVDFVSASADSGTVVEMPADTVTWNGAIPAGGTVEILIRADIEPAVLPGTLVCNQGEAFFDSDGNGFNDTMVLTDDPGEPGAADETCFEVIEYTPIKIPASSPLGLVALALLLAAAAASRLRRRTS